MTCRDPVLIDNPDFGQPHDLYGLPKFPCPCGSCPECIVNNASEWRTRLEIELSCSSSAYFFTLTYDDAHLPTRSFTDYYGNSWTLHDVCKSDVQKFLKRLRKHFCGEKIRYFIVSEYGPTTLRPHYHGIVFGLPRLHLDNIINESKITKIVFEIWNNGHVRVDPVTFGRIAYVTKYLACVTDIPDCLAKPFRLMSRVPGIGFSYLNQKDVVNWHRENLACYYPDGRNKRRLPRYLKDKIFDDSMKLDIVEQVKKSKYEHQNLKDRARDCGYDNRIDYLCDQQGAFDRKFRKQMIKKRKDL